MHRIKTALFALMLALPVPAAAVVEVEGKAIRYALGTQLTAAPLNALQTFTVDVESTSRAGYDLLVMHLDYTYNAATAVILQCFVTPPTGSQASIEECTIASGTCTSDDAILSKAVAAADNAWMWRVDISGYPGDVTCSVVGTGATASDVMTLQAWLTTK